MQQTAYPADVISLCSSDGEIRPLRVRSMDGKCEMLRGNVCEILKVQEMGRYGAETKNFLCWVQTGNRRVLLELRFFYRTHSWSVSSVL